MPVRFSGAKSRLGHSEPVAGLVGLASMAAMLGHQRSHAIMHLRQVRTLLFCLPHMPACPKLRLATHVLLENPVNATMLAAHGTFTLDIGRAAAVWTLCVVSAGSQKL